jgi:hypothetical protein
MPDLIDSLIGYVKDIKPYHTKIFGVDVEYVSKDDINVTVSENFLLEIESILDEDVTVSMTDIKTMEIGVEPNDVEDADTIVHRLWDDPLTGIDTLEYTLNTMVISNDLTSIFNIITGFDIINSTFNDGSYTIVSSIYDSNTNKTTITVNETLNTLIPDGLIDVGMYDAFEYDGESASNITQPVADINAKSTIVECFTITDGFGYDQSSWDDNTSISTWDDSYIVVQGKSDGSGSSTIWDGSTWDASPFDNISSDTGVIAYSFENMPIPNPFNLNTFQQLIPSTVWVFNHNLGHYPITRVFTDSQNGSEVIPLSITFPTLTQVVIIFSGLETGTVRLL